MIKASKKVKRDKPRALATRKTPAFIVHTTIGFDPGSKNFGVSATRMKWAKKDNKLIDIEYIYTGKLHYPIQSLKTEVVQENLAKFLQEIRDLVNKYKPDEIVIERFQIRGKASAFLGTIIELVNVMIGSVLTIAYSKGLVVTLLLAVTWKSAVNRAKLDFKKHLYPINRKNNHVIDAALMTLYTTDTLDALHDPKFWIPFADTLSQVKG